MSYEGYQGDAYNKIQGSVIEKSFRDEAKFILEEQTEGVYKLTKKPKDYVGATENIHNVFEFADEHENVFVERLNGTYERFNFELDSQFPNPSK